MEGISMRSAHSSDYPAIAGILSTAPAWTCYGIDYAIALSLLINMADSLYVATVNNEVVGFITIRTAGVGNIGAYIRMVAVAEEYRNKGVGTMMINFICGIAYKSTPNLFLICSVENTSARTFYEKAGFEQIGLLRDLVIKDHDELLYRKTNGPLQ